MYNPFLETPGQKTDEELVSQAQKGEQVVMLREALKAVTLGPADGVNS